MPVMRRPRRIHPDDKTFMNEVLLRHDRAMREVYRGFERVGRSIDEASQSIDANTARLNDMRGEIRANTQAVLRVLDRLDGGSPA